MSEPAEILELYCAHCGYNLHGIESTRCPECGEAFDRSVAGTSRIPWMHRSEIGEMKAWWRTVWMATFDASALASSVSAPVPYRDARRFWLINTALVLVPVTAYALYLWVTGRMIQPDLPSSASTSQNWPPGVLDLLVPWMMSIQTPLVRITAPVLCIPIIMGLQTYWMGRCGPSRRMQDRAAAIGLYASGVFIGSAIAGLGIGIITLAMLMAVTRDTAMCIGVSIVVAITTAMLLSGITIWRLTRKIGKSRGFVSLLMAGLVPVCWVFCLVLFGFVYPWCVGLVWLMFKSF